MNNTITKSISPAPVSCPIGVRRTHGVFAAALLVPVCFSLLLTGVFAAQETGGLGSISTCSPAPQIVSAAIAFSLSPQSGLTGAQAIAGIQNIVRQASISAPYLAPQIAAAAMQSISRAASVSASSGHALANSTTASEARSTPSSSAITASENYKEAVVSIILGIFAGAATEGKNKEVLTQITMALSETLLRDATEQATLSAVMKNSGSQAASNQLPMDTVEEGVSCAKTLVAAVTIAATRLGFNPQEVANSINKAGIQCVKNAESIGTQVAQQVASSVASQTAQAIAVQVAQETAKEVAKTIEQHVDSETTQQIQQVQQIQGNDQNAPNPIAVGLPAENQNPFTGPPPISQPTATPNPSPTETPSPTPTPTPTPTPPSAGGPG